jgi:cysteine desulfurase
MSEIYLDNAATTRVAPEVAEGVSACLREDYGNPSAAHHKGISAERRIKQARSQLLAAIGDPEGSKGDVYWTSGGTESDAIGVIGPARARARDGKKVVFSATEHPAVRESARQLEREGFTLAALPVDSSGVLDIQQALEAITEDTVVVAAMLVNNEIGAIHPIAELSRALQAAGRKVHIHCDAVQGLGKIGVDVTSLGADSVAFAAHKIHGPKGSGALWLRKGARITPLWAGGGQQEGVRSGTLNVPGIAGMGMAAELASSALPEHTEHWLAFGKTLVAAAEATGVEFRVNGSGNVRAPHVQSIAFRGVPAEPLLHVLESRGVLVSAGSACSERDRKPSPVLEAIKLPADYGTVRLSFGRDTTAAEVEQAAEILTDAVRSFA